MTATEIVEELKRLGLDSYKKILRNHCIPEPVFGVKIEELKKIQKRIKKDYQLALDLYDTGIYDAMYLAGLIADDAKSIFHRDDAAFAAFLKDMESTMSLHSDSQGLDHGPIWKDQYGGP